jgi:hypothetical protein
MEWVPDAIWQVDVKDFPLLRGPFAAVHESVPGTEQTSIRPTAMSAFLAQSHVAVPPYTDFTTALLLTLC